MANVFEKIIGHRKIEATTEKYANISGEEMKRIINDTLGEIHLSRSSLQLHFYKKYC